MFAYERTPGSGMVSPDSSDEGRLALYTTALAREMGLRDFYFSVYVGDTNIEGSKSQNDATVEVVLGSNQAHITYREGWQDWTPEYLREVAVHELCHLFYNDLQDMLLGQADVFGSMFFGPFYEAFRVAMERNVDRLSRAWAEALPLLEIGEYDGDGRDNV